MAEQTTKGPAAAWTGAVDRLELAGKALSAAIKLWDNCGSVPKLEGLAWEVAEAARKAQTLAQQDEAKAFKRLKDAQNQLDIPGTAPVDEDEPPPTGLPQEELAAVGVVEDQQERFAKEGAA